MNTIFMNSENSKTFYPHRLLLNISDEINFLNILLYQILANRIQKYTSHMKNIQKSYENYKFKI